MPGRFSAEPAWCFNNEISDGVAPVSIPCSGDLTLNVGNASGKHALYRSVGPAEIG